MADRRKLSQSQRRWLKNAPTLLQRAGGSLGVDPEALARLDNAERDAVLQELKALELAFKRNPLLGYRPHPKQERFHAAVGLDLRAYFGGNRAGKTTGTMVDTIIQAVDEDVIPEHLKAFKFWSPPFYCRVVTPDLSNTMEGVVLQKFREWTPKDQFRGGNFDRAWDKTLRMLHFKNGSWIQFFSNDQDLDKFGGAALHRVVYDEEPGRPIRNECRMRLIDYGGDELFGMTPLLGMSWVYEEVFEPWQRGDLPEDSVVVVDMEDNPHLAQGEIERALSGFSSEERQARKSGRFVHFEGLVFPEWSEHKHVLPTLEELPEHVECWAGIDPGIRHMAAVVFCFIDQQDCLVVYDEIAVQGKTIREVCDAIHLVNARWNAKPRWYVIDPASRNKNHQTGRSDQQEYIDHGVVALPGQNSVTAGINRIKERLEVDKLLVMAHCRELRREFTRYRWSKPKRMEGDPREQPVKVDDHCLVPGTLITTSDGDVPIEAVEVGDWVWTRGGWSYVEVRAMTNPCADVLQLTLEDGRTLKGTGSHPVWIDGKGFTPLDAVRYDDIMWVCPTSSYSMGFDSVVTPNHLVDQTGCISLPESRIVSAEWADFTRRFGAALTARSQTAGTSTTETATRSTTSLRTWSASLLKRISPRTWMTQGDKRRANTPPRFVLSLPNGTDLPRAVNGTAVMDALLGMGANPSEHPASIAAANMSRWFQSDSAPTAARAPRDGPAALMTKPESAWSVARRSRPTATPPQELVRLRVVGVCKAGQSAVYNLTVHQTPEYFANGVLVHNCVDALRYVAMSRPLPPRPMKPAQTFTQKDRLLRAALDQFKTGQPIDHPSGDGFFAG